jgi:hypothetical protein
MSLRRLALVQGIDDTRDALARWNEDPVRTVGRWALGGLVVAGLLLYAVWVVSHIAIPDDSRPLLLPGLNEPAGLADVARVLLRNSLVLLLHAMACVAGFIAGSSLPQQAEEHRGLWRRIHETAGRAAIVFVAGATLFSLVTQAYVLGSDASTLSRQLGIGQFTLILTLLPHALPELVALFLPLAAWLVASRRGRWDELLAATLATSALAAPVLVLAANVEVFGWPHLLRAVSPLA